MKDIFDLFIKFSPQIFVISAAILLLGGLIWVACQRIPIVWKYYAGKVVLWVQTTLSGLKDLFDKVTKPRENPGDLHQDWEFVHNLAEEIRRGEWSEEVIKGILVKNFDCHCSSRKRSWTPSAASKQLKYLENKLEIGICRGCLFYLATVGGFKSTAATSGSATPAASAASATPAATAQRGGPEKNGLGVRLLFIFLGFPLLSYGGKALLLAIASGEILVIVLGAVLLVVGFLLLRNALTS
ncbi:MAG: hypothetical protein WEC39_02120 [Patescibacteria group bacterium]